MKKRILPFLLAMLLLTGCGQTVSDDTENIPGPAETEQTEAVKSAGKDIFAMDTYMTITCYGARCEEALAAAEAEILRLDALLSVGRPDSEISQINTHDSGTLSEDTRIMVEKSMELYRQTEGAFDITVYPLMVLWGFPSDAFAVPADDELSEILNATGVDKLVYDAETAALTLGSAQGIDLGGIAKGYTSGRLMEIFAEYDLVSGLVSLGGNVQCYGTKPDGSAWRCGIQDPYAADSGGTLMGVLSVADQAVITSGAYERYFTDDAGQIYHHILDPKTGWPADSGLCSVTIVSESGMLADGLSTACYVMGLEKAAAFWREYGEAFDMILMTSDGEVYVTAPLADSFTTDYPMYVIDEEGIR